MGLRGSKGSRLLAWSCKTGIVIRHFFSLRINVNSLQ
jgi:hypothetical protein